MGGCVYLGVWINGYGSHPAAFIYLFRLRRPNDSGGRGVYIVKRQSKEKRYVCPDKNHLIPYQKTFSSSANNLMPGLRAKPHFKDLSGNCENIKGNREEALQESHSKTMFNWGIWGAPTLHNLTRQEPLEIGGSSNNPIPCHAGFCGWQPAPWIAVRSQLETRRAQGTVMTDRHLEVHLWAKQFGSLWMVFKGSPTENTLQ